MVLDKFYVEQSQQNEDNNQQQKVQLKLVKGPSYPKQKEVYFKFVKEAGYSTQMKVDFKSYKEADYPKQKNKSKQQQIDNEELKRLLNKLDIESYLKDKKYNLENKDKLLSEKTNMLKQILLTLNGGAIMLNGSIKYQDNYLYQGKFKEEQNNITIDGQGVLYYNFEKIYEGEFKNNKFHGKGTIKQDNKFYNLIDWRRTDQTEIKGIFEKGVLIQEQSLDDLEQNKIETFYQ